MEEREFSQHEEIPKNLIKISSNEYANVVLLIIALVAILLTLILALKLNVYLSVGLAAILIIVAIKVFKRMNTKVFYDEENLIIKDYHQTYEISLMRLRRIKLTLNRVGSSLKYRIEYLDDHNDFNSISFFVGGYSPGFESFIKHITESYPFVKIERYASSFDS